MPARSCPGRKETSVRLFAFITAAVIPSIVIPCVIISSILIVRGVTAIVVYVLALVVGSAINDVVIVGSHFFVGVCIIKKRFRVRSLSRWRFLSGLRVGMLSKRQSRRGRNFCIVARTLSGGPATVNQGIGCRASTRPRFTSRRPRAMLARV